MKRINILVILLLILVVILMLKSKNCSCEGMHHKDDHTGTGMPGTGGDLDHHGVNHEDKLVRQHIARTRRCRRHHRHCHGPTPENNGH